jgi:hypothetical protein
MRQLFAGIATEICQKPSRPSPAKTLTSSALKSLLPLTLLLLTVTISQTAEAEYRRSYKAKATFKVQNPCPATGRAKGSCPGYIIDHVIPLACGGPDTPANMQWQTKAAALEKDRWERKGCRSPGSQ